MEIIVDSQIATPMLDRVQRNLLTRLPVILADIGAHMVSSIIENFERQGRPNTWPPLAPATLERKTGDMILHESGMLRQSPQYEVQGDTVVIGPSGPASVYAAIHNFGGFAGPGRQVKIPARPWLVFQDEDTVEVRSIVQEELFA